MTEIKKTEVAKVDPQTAVQKTHGQRFMEKVVTEMKSFGVANLSDSQKRLIQKYYIAVDAALKMAEEKRVKQSEQYRDPLSYTWNNVNLEGLSTKAAAYSKIGLDPSLPNHLNFIPTKNKTTNKYDIVFIDGYRGKELVAKKYALEAPVDVTVELKYSTDKFRAIKKDHQNPIESYEFEITDPFDRGTIEGGFYYISYADPKKNRLVVMSAKEIEKRKPKYASAEFWGGEKDDYANGQKTGKKVEIEGWKDEMYRKTIMRKAFGDFAIDGDKIDPAYVQILENDQELSTEDVSNQIDQGAHKETLKIQESTVDAEHSVVEEQTEPTPLLPLEEPKAKKEKKVDPQQPAATTPPPPSEKLF